MLIGGALSLLAASSCGPDPIAPECVYVDPTAFTQGGVWCEGALSVHDPELEWDGPPPDGGQSVCVAPDAQGECASCPLDEVRESLEGPLRDQLAVNTPACELERWEIPCMRTIERGMVTSPTEYCCYHIAYWGPSCGD